MGSNLSPSEALSRIPHWNGDAVTCTELRGGLTNRSYLVERGSDSFVLRLNAAHTNTFNLDRISEMKIMERAAAAGLAPELIFADSDAGILLCRYIPGQVWDDSELNVDRNLEALADLLRRVHELPASGIKFEPIAVASRYARNLESRPGLHAFACHCEKVIAGIAPFAESRCCHNDVVAANIIADSKLKLLDWEYACDNEPMFDLASLIGFHNLKSDRQAILLTAYAGGTDSELSERLDVQLRLYDVIQWLWLANRQLISQSAVHAARLEELQQRIR